MKKKRDNSVRASALQVILALGLISVSAILFASSLTSSSGGANATSTMAVQPDTPTPDVVQLIGPVVLNTDLRDLPYIAPSHQFEEKRLTRYPHPEIPTPTKPTSAYQRFESLMEQILSPMPQMPGPLLTFDGMNSSQSGCLCLPPDTDGDVGPNHYVQSVNSSIKIFDKSGNPLNGSNGTTYNSFFVTLVGTPCSGFNNGDGFVFYDQVADRWVVSDFAFPGTLPGAGPFYQCIGVSQTGDPVSGGWFLYAIQHDPANPTWIGDYPKFALWPDAYYFTVNLFDGVSLGFQGVRAFALDRASMLGGGPANTIAFNITPAGLGDSYSLVPAGFRTGDPPPVGRDEFLLSVDSPATGGVTLTQVHGWKFHADFGTPANSTLGIGVNHSPNANIAVAGFVDAFTTTTLLVPQNGTTRKLDTLGDKIMTPVVYQNRLGVESLWADQTVLLNYPNGPTAVRWYQFNVTGGNFPATPVQQQSWNNGNDGLWRWMPSIAVDQNGNMAIGYSTSSATQEPSIRYAGRLAADPLNNLGQGEAIMTVGGGHQTHSSGRWGDYSMTTIDPVDNLTFWHTNEYYPVTSSASWFTRVGTFQFPAASPTPTPTPTATATPTATPTPAPTPAAPRALKATNVTASSFTANWRSVTGATGYRLDVATDSSFVNYVPGYQDLDVGNMTSYNVTGLTARTIYYYRVRAYNGNGTSPNSNVVQVKTRNH
jgi:Fibronectin type III domain